MMEIGWAPFHTGCGTFTATMLEDVFESILTDNYTRPCHKDLERLARMLDLITGTFRYAKTIGKNANSQADDVREALATLMLFFDERQRAALANGNPRIIESERRLSDEFDSFLLAMEQHQFDLDMDAGLMMAEIENWRGIAKSIAGAFRIAMEARNCNVAIGHSNTGPLPRFMAAVIPRITGENPTPAAIGQHLKRCADKRERANDKT
jgi:hypothetical protein